MELSGVGHATNTESERDLTEGADTVDCIVGEPESRVIFVNGPQPIKFPNNSISTAKYSIISFLPFFLFEQFRRYSNCFFLFIALLQQIPDVSPTGRYTTLVPLIFILLVSAIKEIIEDYKRHYADREVNHREVETLRNGKWELVQWRHVVVGDIVKIRNNQFFPADLLVISSSEPQAMCYIETMNLDGETNLKIRQGLPSTAKLIDLADLVRFRATIECELPNRQIYDFTGVLREDDKQGVPLGPDRILLRGAVLRNTAWVVGVVIYTGHETKLMKNATAAPLKRSTVDKITNSQILMLFGLLLGLCAVSAISNEIWTYNRLGVDWYLGEGMKKSFLNNLLTFVILYNNLIPISLQVTLEVVRFLQAGFINVDEDMYHEETNTFAMARTSNLNEELGMVKFIFSDKTGTLTRNVMEFKACSVAGKIYPRSHGEKSELIDDLTGKKANYKVLEEFLTLMSVCHTVIPEKFADKKDIIYHASSPDERALLLGAKEFGFVFDTRTPLTVEIVALGQRKKYEILNVLEFTSARKRMSVIVRTESGQLKLFCKGADNVIYERLSASGRQFSELTQKHLEEFASAGYRTLCFASTDIDEAKYKDWQEMYHQASTVIHYREKKLEEVANMIELDLNLLGATAVEDKLQDKVPETIATLLKADINVWVLTGDKQETAINIGYSSKLISQGMPLIVLNEKTVSGMRESIIRHSNELGDRLGKPGNPLALVIDGQALKHALVPVVREDFLQLCLSCKSVICCRVSPIQKADVVELVTQNTKSVTLAIGDGANDVAMIQKAHVGIGISGVEGLQAACASDYSIAQFRFLLKLLFVHGAWNYSRVCKLILYSFYKNICLYVIELWFAIYSGWSGQILFERWTIGLYNVLFTAAPPLAIGLFDKICSAETMLTHPKLYSQTSRLFNMKIFWVWIANALYHSIVLFWLPKLACEQDSVWSNGKDGGYLLLGNFVYTFTVVTVCLKAGLHMNSWNIFTHICIWGSILLWFAVLVGYSHFWPTLPLGVVMTGMDTMVFSSPVFWVGLILVPVSALILDVIFLVVRSTMFKTFTEACREAEIKKESTPSIIGDKHSVSYSTSNQMLSGSDSFINQVFRENHSLSDEVFREPAPRRTSCKIGTERARLLRNVRSVFNLRSPTSSSTGVELRHGFAFSQEEGGVVTQSEVIRAYDTNLPKPGGH